jgi:hypothetical protein
MRIFKYPLSLSLEYGERAAAEVAMPVVAEVLHFDFQGSQPALWALVDETSALYVRTFEVYPTGGEVPEDNPDYVRRYVGTSVQGSFVWHCFQRLG